MPLHRRNLGPIEVAAVGLGCMSIANTYGSVDPIEARATIRRALELGVTLVDTADIYGLGENERFVGEVIADVRERVVLATKFGIVALPDGTRGVDARPERVAPCCDASLERLGVDTIDLYYLHRLDPTVPIEETIGAMADLVRAGKVRYLGLSMVGPDTMRRAHAVHPIAALQSEWSLFARDVEVADVPAARALGIGIVAYAPLGRGILTGAVTDIAALSERDARRKSPRFQGDTFNRHAAVVERIERFASTLGVTAAQLAIAWVLAQGPDVVPIPGSSRIRHVESNVAAAEVHLDAQMLARVTALVPDDLSRDRQFEMAGVPQRAGT